MEGSSPEDLSVGPSVINRSSPEDLSVGLSIRRRRNSICDFEPPP